MVAHTYTNTHRQTQDNQKVTPWLLGELKDSLGYVRLLWKN